MDCWGCRSEEVKMAESKCIKDMHEQTEAAESTKDDLVGICSSQSSIFFLWFLMLFRNDF